jgi:hypothetical protein
MKTNIYLCPACFGLVQRESKKKSIKSMCDETGKDAILKKIESVDELAIIMRKQFLPGGVDLSSFKKKEQQFLEKAFEQGVIVTFNRLKLLI